MLGGVLLPAATKIVRRGGAIYRKGAKVVKTFWKFLVRVKCPEAPQRVRDRSTCVKYDKLG